MSVSRFSFCFVSDVAQNDFEIFRVNVVLTRFVWADFNHVFHGYHLPALLSTGSWSRRWRLFPCTRLYRSAVVNKRFFLVFCFYCFAPSLQDKPIYCLFYAATAFSQSFWMCFSIHCYSCWNWDVLQSFEPRLVTFKMLRCFYASEHDWIPRCQWSEMICFILAWSHILVSDRFRSADLRHSSANTASTVHAVLGMFVRFTVPL